MNSGSYKFSFTPWMYDLYIYCRCLVLVLTRVLSSIKFLLERRVYIIYWFVL